MSDYQSNGYWLECAGIFRFIHYQDYGYPEDYQEQDCLEEYAMIIPNHEDLINEF